MKLDVYTRKIHWKIALIAFGTIIGLASLFYTESFLKELRSEEELKKRCDYLLVNDGSEPLIKQVRKLHQELLNQARHF